MPDIFTLLNIAKSESQKSSIRCSHGAVIVDGKRIVSKGYNHNRTQFKNFNNICSCHAERDAVMKLLSLKGWRKRWWLLCV
jgi:deoxycytidylate deaminase